MIESEEKKSGASNKEFKLNGCTLTSKNFKDLDKNTKSIALVGCKSKDWRGVGECIAVCHDLESLTLVDCDCKD